MKIDGGCHCGNITFVADIDPEKVYVKTTAESGTPRVQAFCPECGTPIYSTSVDERRVYGLRIGTISQRAQLRPRKQQWCQSALTWAIDLRSMAQVEKQ